MISIFLDYIYWHFAVAPFEILKIMTNYLIATWHKFLIAQHFRTIFSPWHRQNPSDFGIKSRKFSDKIFDFMADIYIRLIAAFVRFSIILIGLFVELVVLTFFVMIFLLWLVWPVVAIWIIIKGILLLSLI